MRLTLLALTTVGLTAGILFSPVLAEIPHLINYSGKLTDGEGSPLTGIHSITFRIYDAESGGNLLWTEAHETVSVQKGVFSVLLGSLSDLNIAFDRPYFLSIQVGSDDEMIPRQRIASAAYAIRAEVAETVADPTRLIPSGAIIMWSGLISEIPEGWSLCDGTNGTPDLRDRFVVGARADEEGAARTAISDSLTTNGGTVSHAHGFSGTTSATNGNWGDVSWGYNQATDRSHTHTYSGTTQEKSHLPPYYALAFIMKE